MRAPTVSDIAYAAAPGELASDGEGSNSPYTAALARFDRADSRDSAGSPFSAIISQVEDAHESYEGFGKTGEVTLAQHDGSEIAFRLRHRHEGLDRPRPSP